MIFGILLGSFPIWIKPARLLWKITAPSPAHFMCLIKNLFLWYKKELNNGTFFVFHRSPEKLCFWLRKQQWTGPFLKTDLYILHKEQVMCCCFTAACLLICDLFCLWMGLSWWFIEKEPKTTLSKLFTQSHQAEKSKLRLISDFNQNKLYYSFNWTVKPFWVCSACWTCST